MTFVSKASVTSGTIKTYNLRKRIEIVKNCRKIGKKDMKFNDTMPKMKVHPETYVRSYASQIGLRSSKNYTNMRKLICRLSKRTESFVKQSRPLACR